MRILLYVLLARFYHENLLYKISCVDYNHRILSTPIRIFCYAYSIIKLFILLCGFHCVDFIIQIPLSKLCHVSNYAHFSIWILWYVKYHANYCINYRAFYCTLCFANYCVLYYVLYCTFYYTLYDVFHCI